MSDKTGIAWTEATWNPVTGCSKVSPGCAHCYAETLALTRLAGKAGYPGLPWTPENAEANVVLRPDRLDLPLRWRKPRRVFVNSMSDLFHERVPEEFIHRVWVVMESAASHTFQVLTKRPQRMRDILTGCLSDRVVPNVWLGTSIENDRYVGRADALRETPAAVRFISAEPLLGPLVHTCDACGALGCVPDHDPRCDGSCAPGCPVPVPCDACRGTGWTGLDLTGIDWLIIGGESGPGFRPMDPAWVRDLVVQADIAGTIVFVKQGSGAKSGRQYGLPDNLWARKEYPR